MWSTNTNLIRNHFKDLKYDTRKIHLTRSPFYLLNIFILKNSNLFCPNLFGRGERLGCEYTYGTNNHTDYRIYYTSPVQLDPSKLLTISGFRSANDFSWSKYKQNENGIGIQFTVIHYEKYMYSDDILFDDFFIFWKSPFSWTVNNYVLDGEHTFSYEGVWRELVSSLDSAFDVREQSGHSLKSAIKVKFLRINFSRFY